MSPGVQAALTREAPDPLPQNTLQSSDGQIRGSVESAAPPLVSRGGDDPSDPTGYAFEIPIGVDEPIRCHVTGKPFAIGPAAARMLSDKLVDASTGQRVAGLEAGAVGSRPYLYAHVVGTAPQLGHKALYQAKFFFAPLRFGAMHCMHVGLGYSATVRRVLVGLLGSLEFAPQADALPPTYHEVTLTRVGSLTCGFNETRFYQRADGGWGTVMRSVLVAPRSASDVVGLDQVRVTSADGNGVVDHAASDSFEGKTQRYSLALERAPQGFTYTLSGEVHGRAIENTLASHAPLRDDVSLARQIAAGTNGGSWSMPQWMPELQPLSSVDVQVTCPAREGSEDVACDIAAGKVHYEALIDANGMARRTTLKDGPVELETERVYAHGRF